MVRDQPKNMYAQPTGTDHAAWWRPEGRGGGLGGGGQRGKMGTSVTVSIIAVKFKKKTKKELTGVSDAGGREEWEDEGPSWEPGWSGEPAGRSRGAWVLREPQFLSTGVGGREVVESPETERLSCSV